MPEINAGTNVSLPNENNSGDFTNISAALEALPLNYSGIFGCHHQIHTHHTDVFPNGPYGLLQGCTYALKVY
jgi:hypothetical protein